MLAACLLNDHPQILAITAQRAFAHGRFSRSNQNALLGENGVDGLKTGYTQASGYNLITSAVRGNTRLIGVVMGGASGLGEGTARAIAATGEDVLMRRTGL